MPFILSVLQNFIIDKHKKATNFSENIFFRGKFLFWQGNMFTILIIFHECPMNVEYQPFNSSSKSDLTSSETSPSSSAFSSNGYNSSSLEKIRGVDISQKQVLAFHYKIKLTITPFHVYWKPTNWNFVLDWSIGFSFIHIDDDIAAGHLFWLTLSKKWPKMPYFYHIRHDNEYEVSTYFLTCPKMQK